MKRKPNPILPAKERLERNLPHLSSYCRPGVNTGGWPSLPSREFLAAIQNDVLVLAQRERKKPIFPVWKAFLQVDKRQKKLRLKNCVDNLIHRARELLSVESVLAKAVPEAKAGNAQAQCLMRDLVADPQKLVELLGADRQFVIQWCMAQDLLHWTLSIRHPMAKDLHWIAKFLPTKEEVRRQKRWESVQRCRAFKKTQKYLAGFGYTFLRPTRGKRPL
jgi:hypothetical protein